jgi:hypothetical protein
MRSVVKIADHFINLVDHLKTCHKLLLYVEIDLTRITIMRDC